MAKKSKPATPKAGNGKGKKAEQVTMKIGTALNVAQSPDSAALRRLTFPKATDSFKVARSFLQIEKEIEPFNEAMKNIIRKYAECGDDGEPKQEPVAGSPGMTRYKFSSPDDQGKAEEQLRELRESIEVTIDKVSIGEDGMPNGITPAMISVLFILSGEAEG